MQSRENLLRLLKGAEGLARRLRVEAAEAYQAYLDAVDAAMDDPDPETGGLRPEAQANINRLWERVEAVEHERLAALQLVDMLKADLLSIEEENGLPELPEAPEVLPVGMVAQLEAA